MDKAFKKSYRNDLHQRFVAIDFTADGGLMVGHTLLVDRETGIEYLLTANHSTLLVNPDGSSKINEKWRNGEL